MRPQMPRVVILTIVLVAICAPHAAEDFQFGEFARRGITPAIPAIALGLIFAMQVAGAYLTARGSAAGYALLVAAGTVWCVGALVLHGPEILASGPYRNGVTSKALEVGIIVVGAATAIAGTIEWGKSNRRT